MIQYLQRKIDRSRAIIEQMLSLCYNPYLALSFGKDSLVMLDLVQEQCPDIPCLFLKSEESYLLSNYEALILHYKNAGVNIQVIDMVHFDYDFENGKNIEFQQVQFFDGWDGVFMGIRIEESKARRISIIAKENNQVGYRIMQYKTGKRAGFFRACPIADWTGFETFVYCQDKGLKMLDVYDSHEVRSSAQLPYSNNIKSALFQVKTKNLSGYNALIKMIPELNIYS